MTNVLISGSDDLPGEFLMCPHHAHSQIQISHVLVGARLLPSTFCPLVSAFVFAGVLRYTYRCYSPDQADLLPTLVPMSVGEFHGHA